jgi:hypothetical protein
MGRSSYPEQLDTDLEIPRVDNNVTEIGGDSINALRDAVFGIQETLGISPQGNAPSLADRIASVIDSNGNIKSSALESAGLVSLPINNSHIGTNAGITESKLSLDFSTSSLNSRLNSFLTDITALEASFNALFGNNASHYSGDFGRHDGYDIDLQIPVRGATVVEEALNEVNNAFTAFENYANDIFSVINIDALNSIISDILDIQLDITSGRDSFFNSATMANERGGQGTQGNSANTAFASTIFQTSTINTRNILQVMRPNVARVSGKTPDLGGLSISSTRNLRIQAGGMDRDPLDIDLGSPSIIPTDDIDEVVAAINTEARSDANHYPISAYNVNGRLIIAHNLPGPAYTIKIESGIFQSAHTQLGFNDVADTEFSWSDGYHSANVGGNIITDMKPLLRIRYAHSSGDTIDPAVGNLLNLFDVDSKAEGKIICNILNHSVTGNNSNGTYYIRDLEDSSFKLNTNVPFGEFDIDIVADSVNFESTSEERVYDIFLEAALDGYDGYGLVTKSLRAKYLAQSNMSIKTFNKAFPTTGTMRWRVTGNDTLELYRDGLYGVPVSIPNGFRGQLQVFMPDNINSVLVEITGNPSSSTKDITDIFEFGGSSDRVYLSSVHHPTGTSILRYVVDKRQLGTSVIEYQDELDPDSPESSLKYLRNNGVMYGFDVISYTTNTIKVRGGRALVEGKVLDVETTDVTIDSFNDEFILLALDRNGTYKTFDEDEAGYTAEELAADGYSDARQIATILDFGTTLSGLTGQFVDRRIFIDKIDGKLLTAENRLDSRIDQLVAATSNLWGFTSAFTTEPAGDFIASVRLSSNPGFRFLDEPGFLGIQTTRRYEFLDPSADAYSLFKAPGLTHINIMLQAEYADESGVNPFGVSGTVGVDVGANVVTGIANDGYSESYVRAKTMSTTIMPSNSIIEQYVASIPISEFSLDNNIIFDVIPRIRITGSTYVDGGGGGGALPTIKFGKVRIIVSSYSVAGNILGIGGVSTSLATNLGDVL